MTWFGHSLRLRLSVLILLPLLIVSAFAVVWRFDNARTTSEGIFDRNLVMLSLAVSRDVAFSGGDTLSETTSNLFKDATGGTVFYHVYGPDGSFVTGYSSPPVRDADVILEPNTPLLFDAIHQGEPVRAASLSERANIDGITGTTVVTVWQQLQPRRDFAQSLALQALFLALLLVATVAAVVFFGIRLGLRPLQQLEAAIQKRSSTDLSPIERQIPLEAAGIVGRLNDLFNRLTDAQSTKDRLISNAAHQLRNPVAAIHTMAQAIETSTTHADSQKRAAELVSETRQTMRLTQQMLSLERLQGKEPVLTRHDLNDVVQNLATRLGPRILNADIAFEVDLPDISPVIQLDETLLAEAVTNLVENALHHAGPSLSFIRLEVVQSANQVVISVENDGRLIDANTAEHIFERFSQGSESQGAGLGLAIAQEVARRHEGQVVLKQRPTTRFEIHLGRAGD